MALIGKPCPHGDQVMRCWACSHEDGRLAGLEEAAKAVDLLREGEINRPDSVGPAVDALREAAMVIRVRIGSEVVDD